MKSWATAAPWILGLTVAFPATGFTASDEAQARRYEHMMVKASELRHEAERIRSEAAEQGRTEAAHPKAKALDRQADELVERARRAEPADWPPSE
ncbi:MAG: hypothetical protein ACREQ9_17490 [Candidatus Binatia bacterium]